MSPTETQHDQAISLEDLAEILRRRLRLIVAVVVIFTAASYFVISAEQKQYTATASVVFNNNIPSLQVTGVSQGDDNNPTGQQQTDLDLVTLGNTALQTAQAVGHGMTATDIRNAISASAVAESNVVQIAATNPNPSLAKAIANTYAQTFVRDQVAAAQKSYSVAQAVVQKQLEALSPQQRSAGAGADLETRVQTLEELSQLQAGLVKIVQTAAFPNRPSSPRPKRDTAIALIIAIIAAFLLALLVDRFDRRIRDPKDLQDIYGLPVLGTVPESSSFATTGKSSSELLAPSEAEVFSLLRAHLRYFNVAREVRLVAVTSAAPGDGKTTVARHLARAAAGLGSKVLLIEADLRRPTLADALGLRGPAGLAGMLLDGLPLAECIAQVPVGSSSTADGPSFDVLFAGKPLPPNPVQLFESPGVAALLQQARDTYDFVLLDTPPLTLVPDAFPLLALVDGVLIVGRINSNNRAIATRLQHILEDTNALLLGIVANGVRPRKGDGYGYGYPSSGSAPAGHDHGSTTP